MSDKPPYWFPAKRYGWGWGLPTAWQGWVVIVVYFALLAAGTMWVVDSNRVLPFLGYTLGLSGILLVVCWRKGEPPRWRWGAR